MQNKDKNYFFLVIIHLLLGFAIYAFPFLSKIYSLLIIFGGIYFVVKTQNKNNEVLYASAYIVGSEVFLRMTDGNPIHEFAKYGVMIFLFFGMFYSGFSKNAVPYWVFLLLLVPSIIIATFVLDPTTDIRKTISFNISGPVCLGIASLYTFNRKITIGEINNILLMLGMPIITTASYLFFYTPSNIREVLTGTGSNNDLSGGFGPNQVATILGLGLFIFFSRLILASRTKFIFMINLVIMSYVAYRGMLTFSRGGMLTGFGMIIILILFLYLNSKYKGKVKLNYFIVFLSFALLAVWFFTSYQTDGLIEKRYQNKDALGREKKDKLTGRGELAEGEYNMFLENPIFGVGVAKGTEIRKEQNGELAASHDEVTRMLAEHGSLGIMALLILIFTPIILFLGNKQNIFMFCFFFFWISTINHAAMRTAAPSFVYALAILKIKPDEEEPIVYRKQTIKS